MKKVFLFAFLSTMAMSVNAENTDISSMDNVVYIEPCTAQEGSQYVLSVKMKNSVEVESFGFDLVLPEGITVALDDYGDPIAVLSEERTNSSITNNFDADFKLDGSLNIQAYSSKGRTISGNDGEVALITINIAEDMPLGIYQLLLKNIAISDANSVTYTEDLVETSIEIISGDGRTVLDETSTTAPAAATNVDVRVKRTINANEWSTICLPFAMTEAQVKEAFGEDVQLADFKGYEVTEDDDENIVGITVNFDDVTAIEANHPYIIKVSSPVTEFTVDNVEINPIEEPKINFGTNRKPKAFIGTYVAGTVLGELTLFLSGNKFWYSTGNTKMKAFRAYFDFFDVLTEVEEGSTSVKMYVNTDDDATGIDNVNTNANLNETIYNLAGQRINKAQKGINIVNGKKVIIK